MPDRVFITGGNGMVGRNLREHPAADRYEVFAPGRAELDLFDAVAVERYIGEIQPDLVIHVAGRVGGIAANMSDPVGFLVENVDIGRNVIIGAHRCGVHYLLNVSSSCMYPREAINPLREEFVLTGELEPTNEGYAIGKIYAQRLCAYVSTQYSDRRYKTLIPCNQYGRYDHFDTKISHLLPAAIMKTYQAMVQGKRSINVWGDGQARREFMYAGDLADCIWQGVDRFDALPALMNVGLGHDFTVLEYYEAVRDVLGWRGEFALDPTKPSGMRQKLVDIGQQKEWGWAPLTSLRDGIARCYSYYLENLKENAA